MTVWIFWKIRRFVWKKLLESNLASPWNRGLGQFGIGLFVRNIPGKDYKLSSCRAVFDYSGCIYAKKVVNLNPELKLTRRILDGKWTVVNLVRVIASIHGSKFNCFHIRASLLASNRGRRFRRPFNFPSNRQLFNEIIAYQELFCVVTLLASWNNQDDGEGNEKIKKSMQQYWLINRKKPERAAHILKKIPHAIVAGATLSNFIEKVIRSSPRRSRPRPHVSR